MHENELVREFKRLLFIIFHAVEEGEPERVPEDVKKRLVELADKLFSDPWYRAMTRIVAETFDIEDRERVYWMIAHLLFVVDGIGH